MFFFFDGFRVDEDDPENTVAACSLLELSRNANHTEYVCTVDMTELLADIRVQVDATEIADRQHVISIGFYMKDNSKYKNDGLDICCLSLSRFARPVWARSEQDSQGWGAVLSVHSSERDTVILLLLL